LLLNQLCFPRKQKTRNRSVAHWCNSLEQILHKLDTKKFERSHKLKNTKKLGTNKVFS